MKYETLAAKLPDFAEQKKGNFASTDLAAGRIDIMAHAGMENFDAYSSLKLRGGFLLKHVQVNSELSTDALGRPAIARTAVVGSILAIELRSGLSEKEISISLYHEVLEAATVAAIRPPSAVMNMNEADFEAAAQRMHADFGPADSATLNQLLELYGF